MADAADCDGVAFAASRSMPQAELGAGDSTCEAGVPVDSRSSIHDGNISEADSSMNSNWIILCGSLGVSTVSITLCFLFRTGSGYLSEIHKRKLPDRVMRAALETCPEKSTISQRNRKLRSY